MSAVPGDVRADAIPFQTLMRAGRLFQAISLVARDRECVLLIAQELHRAARPSVPPAAEAREEAIREDERDRLYEKAAAQRVRFLGKFMRDEGAMLPAERQRLRQETGEA